MSRLDELKSGAPSAASQQVDIDMTADIDGLDHNNTPKRVNMTRPTHTSTARRTIDTTQLEQNFGIKNEMDKDQGEGAVFDPDKYATNILQGEGSVFDKWKKEKIEEYNERMAQFDEEREELIEQGKLDPKDIKDDDYQRPESDNEDPEKDDENDEDEEDMESTDNKDLVLDNDDLLAELEDDSAEKNDPDVWDDEEDEKTEAEESVVAPEEDPADEDEIEQVKEETPKKEEKKTVHITEEDREIFDAVGSDVDSSRFDTEDKDEEEAPKKEVKKTSDEVLDDEDEEVDDEASDRSEETLKHLKELITERIQPSFKTLDITQFQIRAKKSTGSNVKSITDGQQLKVVKWVLPNQKQCVFMKQFTGLELQTLSENIQEGSLTSMNIAYRMIYDHIVSNKPGKFTDWLAVTPDSDIDHYMFCVFIASYKGTNFLPMDCPNNNCPDPTFLTDDIPIMDMVKFKDDESKVKFMEIYKSEIVYSNKSAYYVTAITPVSNQIAIGFKESTLKDVIDIEGLDERFRNKYKTTINLIPYIDAIYQIDYDTQSLIEIKANTKDTDNHIKLLRSKIRTYAKLIDTLTSDEFGVINAVINGISTREDMLSYIVPAVECPACGRKIDEVATSATQLVFTRYQLGALVNTTLN